MLGGGFETFYFISNPPVRYAFIVNGFFWFQLFEVSAWVTAG